MSNKKITKGKYRSEFSGSQVFDYKDPVGLSKFISDAGRIVPARIAKLSIAQQKQVAAAVKKARNLALLPSGTEAYDSFNRPEQISPAPFDLN